ncbi:MAG TPA: hypothetical protein VH477_00295 [Bryobacteraceae bacterium]|jgi:hypothetical protein
MDPQIMEALAGKLGGDQRDPLVSALLASMMKPQDQQSEPELSTAAFERWKQTVRRLRSQLAAAEQMLSDIANVFGACELCWGEDPSCPRCRGRGRPGNAIPIEADLLRWVEPALGRLGYEVSRRGASTSATAPVTNSRREN